MDVICRQMSDPTEIWDVSDVPKFRRRFSGLLDYLPAPIPSSVQITSGLRDAASGLLYTRITPERVASRNALVYLHGGGFVLSNDRESIPEAAFLAERLGVETLVVDYPLAPENRHPIQMDSILSFGRSALGSRPFHVAGESAGAALGLMLAASAPRWGGTCVNAFLMYPWLDLTLASESMVRFARGYFLTKPLLDVFRSYYLQPGDTDYAAASVLHKVDPATLPPVFCAVGQYDPLLDDSVTLIERMNAASSKRGLLHVEPGMLHGYVALRGMTSARNITLNKGADFLRAQL